MLSDTNSADGGKHPSRTTDGNRSGGGARVYSKKTESLCAALRLTTTIPARRLCAEA